MIEECVKPAEDPSCRPTFAELARRLDKIGSTGSTKDLLLGCLGLLAVETVQLALGEVADHAGGIAAHGAQGITG